MITRWFDLCCELAWSLLYGDPDGLWMERASDGRPLLVMRADHTAACSPTGHCGCH